MPIEQDERRHVHPPCVEHVATGEFLLPLGEAKLVREAAQGFLLPLWNALSFFTIYANIDGFDPSRSASDPKTRPEIDRWILSELNLLVDAVTAGKQPAPQWLDMDSAVKHTAAGVGFYAYLLTNILWLQYVWGYDVLRAGLALRDIAMFGAAFLAGE